MTRLNLLHLELAHRVEAPTEAINVFQLWLEQE